LKLVYLTIFNSAGKPRRAACERSKGAGCKRTRVEGGRQLPFTAGLARFFASALGKTRVAIERNETMPEAVMKQYPSAKRLLVFTFVYSIQCDFKVVKIVLRNGGT